MVIKLLIAVKVDGRGRLERKEKDQERIRR